VTIEGKDSGLSVFQLERRLTSSARGKHSSQLDKTRGGEEKDGGSDEDIRPKARKYVEGGRGDI